MTRDDDSFRIRPGKVRDRDATRLPRVVRQRAKTFIGEVHQAIRRAGGNPNRLAGTGKGSGRFKARGRGAQIAAAIENGVADICDPALKGRLAELSAIRDQARADSERAAGAIERAGPELTTEKVKAFATAARRRLRNKDGGYRRDHLRAVAQRIEVVGNSEVRIMGTKTELLRTLAAAASVGTAAGGVPTFESKWRARNDSNVRPPDS